jgi:hypothetical protein
MKLFASDTLTKATGHLSVKKLYPTGKAQTEAKYDRQ